jgi:GNAT superfamily N-acetyltransferase
MAAIVVPLIAFNRENGPPINRLDIALTLRDERGNLEGGLWGRAAFDWLFVEYLAVPPHLRGNGAGTALMLQAERIAREHGCIGIWLDTFSFQARPFYEKLGYTLFGQLDDHPRGGTRYFMQKRLA